MGSNGDERRYISVKEAAARYGISDRTVRQSVADGVLPALRVGRQIRLDPLVLDELFAAPATRTLDGALTVTRPKRAAG